MTAIYCSAALKNRWPSPLASEWLRDYPGLFDRDDLRLAMNQPANHFCEWFAAIHLFHRDNAVSLVEKYGFGNHARKVEMFRRLVPEKQRRMLRGIAEEFSVQLPDLFVIASDWVSYSFGEVKGPGDRVQPKQADSHRAIRSRLGVDVEIFEVRIVNAAIAAFGVKDSAAEHALNRRALHETLMAAPSELQQLKDLLDEWAAAAGIAQTEEGKSFKYRVAGLVLSLIVSERKLDFNLSGMRKSGAADRATAIVDRIREINPKATETQPGISCTLAFAKWNVLHTRVLSLVMNRP